MECLTFQSGKRTLRRSVDIVTENRMSDTLHMHTNLMCASGLQLTLNVGKPVKRLQYPVMRDGILSIWNIDRHQLAILWMTSDRCVDHPVFGQSSMHDCTVFARDGMYLELCRNPLVGTVIFTNNQRSGRILINAMYDSGTQYTIDSG